MNSAIEAGSDQEPLRKNLLFLSWNFILLLLAIYGTRLPGLERPEDRAVNGLVAYVF